ncbi:hypothetical protein Hanom_Chr15g01396361 [Helianthus anomalus]
MQLIHKQYTKHQAYTKHEHNTIQRIMKALCKTSNVSSKDLETRVVTSSPA